MGTKMTGAEQPDSGQEPDFGQEPASTKPGSKGVVIKEFIKVWSTRFL